MTNKEWRELLQALSTRLTENGIILILSASLLTDQPKGFRQHYAHFKNICRMLFNHISGKMPQQFWGWMRTEDEYVELCKQAGLSVIGKGQLGDSPNCLWITAKP